MQTDLVISKQGFTLVELSIVLVILGLLTGGILTGQSLIRAAELRAVVTEYNRYATAIRSFQDKYQAIPGDMKTATKFWGDDAAACADAAVTDGVPGTCNGNGNGQIQTGAANATSEMFQFWKQLALAGLIEGSYSGLAGPGGFEDTVIGTNVPASKLSNGGFSGYYSGSTAGDASSYAISYNNHLVFGADNGTLKTQAALLKPEEAWNIDMKVDDGKPARGKIAARFWNNACAIADDGTHAQNDLNASYKLSDSDIECALYFLDLF